MFSEIDDKIKGLAIGLFVLGCISSIVYGYFAAELDVALGIIYGALGLFFSWLVSSIVYGFGELIAKAGTMKKQLEEIKELLTPPPAPIDPNRNWQPNTDDFLLPTGYGKSKNPY